MNFNKNKWSKVLAMFLAVVMTIMAMPMSAFAAVASDLPDNMADHAILRALEYTGYDVQKQKNDGTLYQSGSYGSRTPADVLSGINYGTSTSGKETVADSSTVTGRAPDIAKFQSKGLCCASFVTYFVCNYLPNIEGANTQFILDAINATGMNSQAVVTWQTALNKLANEGKVEKIGTSSSNVDRSKLAPGDLIIFGTAENSHTHIAVYSGTYKGTDFLIHVGNDRGPEIMPVAWMSQAGDKSSYPNAYYHLPSEFFEDDGTIEIYKKDTEGKALAGATFTATDTVTGKSYVIGPTDSKGYAEATLPYATYKVVESKFPTNYRAYGTSSWTVTLNSSSPNGTITINAVNELIPGNCKIVKTSEDGKVDGIDFTISGNGVNKTVTTANGGQITVKDLKPGTYTVTEKAIDKYEPQSSQSVTIVSGQTATVNFSNTLKRGDLKVTKTSEDGLVEGVQFKLTGTSLSGETIEQFAVTNAKGIATFSDVLISGNVKYTLSEVNTADRYEVPASQSVAVEWNKVTEASVYNKLKRGDLKITKTSEDGMVEGVKFRLTGTSLSGEKIDLTATTNANGVAMFEDVLITGHSTYTVTEVDTKAYYITPAAQSVSIAWNEVTNKSFYNELKRGSLRVQKTSEDGFVEDMRFRLVGTSDSGIKVDETVYTDANGVALFEDILIGKNYVLTEERTPTRYVVPAKQTVDIAWNTVTGASVENILKKWRADVFKVDGYLYWGNPEEDNGLVPMVMSANPTAKSAADELGWPYGETQGDATLEGAVYGVYKNGDLVDTYTTNKDGWFITKYYPCGDNNEWTIREISASEGYLLDPTVYYVDAHPGNYSVELNTEYIDVYEAIIRGKISIIKHADDGSTQIEHPEENAVFEVYLKSAGSYENARETERALLVTDAYGYAETPEWLPYGVYTVKQTKGLEGKELIPAFDVRINEDGKTYRYLINNATFEAEIEIVKKDAETGKVIPASGIGFKVRNTDTGEYVIQHINYPTPMDIEIYYTDASGKLMLPYALPYSLNNIKSKTVGDGQHGTARWANKAEIKKTYVHVPFTPKKWRKQAANGQTPTVSRIIKKKLFRKKKAEQPESELPQGIVVGCVGGKNSTTALVDTGDVHTMMVGAAGVGKTAYWLYPCIEYAAASGMSFLSTDTKGDIMRNYGHIVKSYGYNVSVIDLRNPTRSNGNNLLHLVNKYMDMYQESGKLVHKAKAEKYAKIISKTIILSGMDAASFGQNAYFYDAAEGLLTATILLVAEFCPPETRHIVSVFKIIQELLTPSNKKKGRNEFQLLMERLPKVPNIVEFFIL